MRYVAAFRTHAWDDDIAELARRFFHACPSGRKVVLPDETHGPLGIEAYEVIPHTKDLTALGLPDEPAGMSLWHNNDYALQVLRHSLPYYDFYLMSEQDVAINIDLEPIVELAVRHNIDLIAHDVSQSKPDWYWYDHAAAVFDRPWRAFLVCMLASAAAADHLLSARREHAAKFEKGDLTVWQFAEAFVPSTLATSGFRFAEWRDFADTTHLRWRPRIPQGDARANRAGSLAHPVMADDRLIAATLRAYPPADWFVDGSLLRQDLQAFHIATIAAPLCAAFQDAHDHVGLARLIEQAESEGIRLLSSPDLAYCKPALTSSTCQWSHYPEPGRDAAGANGHRLPADFGFHTDEEREPWWRVDLRGPCAVEEVVILNRLYYAERFRMFAIESSLNGETWRTRYRTEHPIDVSSDPDHPWRLAFDDPFVARHVRITLLGYDAFHLRRVQIFGSALATPHPPREGAPHA